MKSHVNPENTYSLHNVDNFNKILEVSVNDVINKYVDLYISTGNYVVIDTSTLIGRIISTDETTDGSVANQTSTITAP